jgi:hypothetical protein
VQLSRLLERARRIGEVGQVQSRGLARELIGRLYQPALVQQLRSRELELIVGQ